MCFQNQVTPIMQIAISEKPLDFATRLEAMVFHHDNARPHVKKYLERSGW